MPSSARAVAHNAAYTIALLSLLVSVSFAQVARSHTQTIDHPRVQKRGNTYAGCFSSSTGLNSVGTYEYQSSGYCSNQCVGKQQPVLGLTSGNECFCGTELPPASSKVDDIKCSIGCTGYGQEKCGGNGFFTVYTDGIENNVPNADASSSTSSASSSSTSTTTTTNSPSTSVVATVVTSEVSAGQTVIVTQIQTTPQTSTPSPKSGGSGSNTAGIAAGVVIGIVLLAAAVAGVFFFLRYRKRQQAQADYNRRSQVADFMRGVNERKPPGTGYSGASDQRLDPETGRRNSAGSLADNQDYSRRILRVANPDSS